MTPDDIIAAYLGSEGDPMRALRKLAEDTLADLVQAERELAQVRRLVSQGYVRAAPVRPGRWVEGPLNAAE